MNRVCLRFRALYQNVNTLQMEDVCPPVYSGSIFNGSTYRREIWVFGKLLSDGDGVVVLGFFMEEETWAFSLNHYMTNFINGNGVFYSFLLLFSFGGHFKSIETFF